MDNKELASVLEKVKSGDNDAISALVREYSGRVQNMAKIYGGDHIDVKNVTVRAFAKTIRHLNELQDPSGFEEFLYDYVRQEAMNASQKEGSENNRKTEEKSVPPVPKKDVKDSIKIPAFKPKPIEETEEKEYDFVPPEKDETSRQKEIPEAEEETEDIPVKKTPVKKQIIEYEDDDEDEEDDDYEDEKGGFPSWLLVILIVIAIIVLVCLGLYFFMPELWDTIAESANDRLPIKLPYSEKTDEEEQTSMQIETAAPLATMTAAPVESLEPTVTPTVDAESILEGGDAAPLTTPTPTPESTPTSTPSQQTSGVVGKITVNVDNLNIRASASTSSDSKGHASKGNIYDVYETTTAGGYTWYRIGEDQWIADNGSWATYTAN